MARRPKRAGEPQLNDEDREYLARARSVLDKVRAVTAGQEQEVRYSHSRHREINVALQQILALAMDTERRLRALEDRTR